MSAHHRDTQGRDLHGSSDWFNVIPAYGGLVAGPLDVTVQRSLAENFHQGILFGLARQHRVENLRLPLGNRISHERAQFRSAQPGQRFHDLFVLNGADKV